MQHRLPQYWSVVDNEHTDDGEQLDASRPAFSFTCLIGVAILSAEHRKLPVGHVYEYIARNFPYFQTAAPSWRNSVRHVLSLDKFFHKPPKNGMKGAEWEVKMPMLGLLVGLIAEGQARLPPATARHLGLPDLRNPTAFVKSEAAVEATAALKAAAATATATATAPPPAVVVAAQVAAAQTSAIRVKTEMADRRTAGRRAQQQIPSSVAAAAASLAFPAAAPPTAAVPVMFSYQQQQQQQQWNGLVPLRFDVGLDDLDGLNAFEASSSSSASSASSSSASSASASFAESYSSDSSTLSIHDVQMNGAAHAEQQQQQQQQLRRKRSSSDRRFSTADWSVLPQDEAIIATMFGSQAPAAVF